MIIIHDQKVEVEISIKKFIMVPIIISRNKIIIMVNSRMRKINYMMKMKTRQIKMKISIMMINYWGRNNNKKL